VVKRLKFRPTRGFVKWKRGLCPTFTGRCTPEEAFGTKAGNNFVRKAATDELIWTMEQQKSLYDTLSEGLGDAVADVRAKYEEAVWGREVTAGQEAEAPQWPQAREQEPEPAVQEQEREREPDVDIDR
jgi:hypothetical protein